MTLTEQVQQVKDAWREFLQVLRDTWVPAIGTRSVLYGYHCFFLHGWFVARAWYHLHKWADVQIGVVIREPYPYTWVNENVYTSLKDYRLWLAFFLHDIGYWGKPNMDGPEGERHPFFAYRLMDMLFGSPWGTFCLYHSRFLAKSEGEQPSMLCAPDKLAIALYPRWLFIFLVRITGEIKEYMKQHKTEFSGHKARVLWATEVQKFAREYAEKMRHGGTDTVTGGKDELNTRRAEASGV